MKFIRRKAAEYIYDPDHLKKPAGDFHQTPKGWSDSSEDDSVTEKIEFRKMPDRMKARVILQNDKAIVSAIGIREKYDSKYGSSWLKRVTPEEKTEWEQAKEKMIQSIR